MFSAFIVSTQACCQATQHLPWCHLPWCQATSWSLSYRGTLWLNPTATQWKRSYMLTCSQLSTRSDDCVGQPIFFLPWMVWHNRISPNRGCKTLNPLISAVLSQTSGRHIWSTGRTPNFETPYPREYNSKRSTNTLVSSTYQKGFGHSSFAWHFPQIYDS